MFSLDSIYFTVINFTENYVMNTPTIARHFSVNLIKTVKFTLSSFLNNYYYFPPREF